MIRYSITVKGHRPKAHRSDRNPSNAQRSVFRSGNRCERTFQQPWHVSWDPRRYGARGPNEWRNVVLCFAITSPSPGPNLELLELPNAFTWNSFGQAKLHARDILRGPQWDLAADYCFGCSAFRSRSSFYASLKPARCCRAEAAFTTTSRARRAEGEWANSRHYL
jgi:hypothetical protein